MQSFRRRRTGSGGAGTGATGGAAAAGGGGGGITSPSPSRKRGLGHLTGSASLVTRSSIPRTVRVSSSQGSTTNQSVGTGVRSLAEAESDFSMRGSSSVSVVNRGTNTVSGVSPTDALERYRSFNAGEEEALVGSSEARRARAHDAEPAGISGGDGGGGGGPRGAMGKDAVAKDERRASKFFIRAASGLILVSGFSLVLFSGHVYICALVALVEIFLFRELVKVRYNTFFHIIEDTIPMFRTTQWLWFCVAIFYTYSDFVFDVIKSNTALHYLLIYDKLQTPLAFALYSGTFIITIATMQAGHIKFQLNQLCWTIVVLCLTVGQLKYVMHNVYNGLFWFALPLMLVITNDCFAYICGMLCGRKFIRRPFIALSPNKTWEGFIGGAIFTIIMGWYLSRIMAHFTWFTCPTNQFRLLPERLECELDPIFLEASSIFNPQVFEIIPDAFTKMIPGIVDICAVDGDAAVLTPCISGEETHTHHHFELVLKNVFPVQIHALGLAAFASLVAPFGGFLASAIKRAYGIKDFDSIIPGHGGLMDRLDCQFMMALFTWVHYNTFVKMATVSVPKMIYMYSLMKESEQKEFLERIMELSEKK